MNQTTKSRSFIQVTASGQRVNEMQLVSEYLKTNKIPVSSRVLSIETGIERTNLTRTLYDLTGAISKPVVVAETSKCEITGRQVQKYMHADNFPEWKAKQQPN